MEKINLLGLNKIELEEFFISIDEKPFRARQIIKWVHQRGVSDFTQMTDLSKDLRAKLESHCIVKAPEVIYEKTSQDGTRKWVISVGGNDLIEMVLIPEKNSATNLGRNAQGSSVFFWY
jgi:23S rRNA (adenine2503-C2)-methyltransferase